jgi:hypothetical protein
MVLYIYFQSVERFCFKIKINGVIKVYDRHRVTVPFMDHFLEIRHFEGVQSVMGIIFFDHHVV